MIITIIFPQKIIHRGIWQNWTAQSLEHMVQILCGVWWEWTHAPLKLLNRPKPSRSLSQFLYLSLRLNLLCFLCFKSAFLTCDTNHLYGFPWHLLCFSPFNRISKFHKWSTVHKPWSEGVVEFLLLLFLQQKTNHCAARELPFCEQQDPGVFRYLGKTARQLVNYIFHRFFKIWQKKRKWF